MAINNEISAGTEVFKLAPGDINHLFRRSGLKGNSLSNFTYNGEQAAVSSATDWFKVLTESSVFSKIARNMLEPDLKISFSRGGNFSGSEQYYALFSSKDNSVLAKFTNDQGELILMIFPDELEFCKWWAGVYASEGIEDYKSISSEKLDIEVMLCILHCLDIYKRSYMESMLDYRKMVDVSISTSDFVKLLKTALASSDTRWYLPSLFQVAPALKSGKLSLKQEHIKKLEELGFIKCDDKLLLTMSEKGRTIGTEFLTSWMGSIGLQASSLVNGQEKVSSQIVMTPTAFTNHLVTFEAGNDMNYKFRHEALTREAVTTNLQKWLKSLDKGIAADSVKLSADTDKKPKFCGYCGSKLYPGKKFCTNCGEKV